MLATSLIVGSLFAGYIYVKKYNNSLAKSKDLKWYYDTSFSTQNIPLHHKQTQLRDQMLSDVKYEVFLILTKEDIYEGKIIIEFKLTDKNIDDLFLDFQGVGVSEIIVNDKLINEAAIRFEKHKLYIPKYDLKSNSLNRVSLKFQNTYVTNSAGFHRYQDPVDKEIYLYTHLEPFFCNRWFPCFDQPSIRAPFSLRVVTPDQKWQAISNDIISQQIQISSQIAQSILKQQNILDIVEKLDIPENGNLIIFNQSPPISTYIYALAAGPYCSIQNETDYKVPMKIYCRKSKIQHADAKEKFRGMELAINFFEDFFSCPFPFKKYDMVFVPEFRISGMENVGIVIMRDTFLRPAEEKNFFEFQQWNKVSVHELSHMWFGDLVTMKWWNDLWLKESFAEYCTCVCLVECPDFNYVKNPDQIGLHFLTEALNDDTKRTTHPIQVTVNHTNDAINVYDKICYRKGAAFLRQIDQFLGREIMQDGIRIYFRDFKFQNTTLQDFINCLQIALTKKQNDIDLQEWVDSWLTKAGVNELKGTLEQTTSELYTIFVEQSYPRNGDQVYHQQVIDVGVFDDNGNIEYFRNLHIYQHGSNKENLVQVFGQKPSAVLVNANNKGYCRTVFDEESLQFFLKKLSSIQSDLNRNLIWRILCDNLKIKVLTGSQFLQCVIDHIGQETEEYTMPTVLATVQWVLKYLMIGDQNRGDYIKRLQLVYLEKLKNFTTKSMEILILQEFISLITDDQVDEAIKWVKESKIALGDERSIVLEKQERYALLRLIFRSTKYDENVKRDLLAQEKAINFSDLDVLEELGCEASLPDDDSKFSLWYKYIIGTSLNVKGLEASAKCFYNYANLAQCEEIANRFYDSVESIFSVHHRDYALQFFTQLSPTFLRREKDLIKLKEIYDRQRNSENTNFVLLLSNEIELLESLLY